jgi:hypothetical protein
MICVKIVKSQGDANSSRWDGARVFLQKKRRP